VPENQEAKNFEARICLLRKPLTAIEMGDLYLACYRTLAEDGLNLLRRLRYEVDVRRGRENLEAQRGLLEGK
jgi:hypothetical protein